MVEAALASYEDKLDRGQAVDARADGFWRLVAQVKKNSQLIDEFAERIAAVDRRIFLGSVMISIPFSIGTWLMAVGTVLGLLVVAWAYSLEPPVNGLALLVGTGILEVTTHGLAHLTVGARYGMRFTHWFIASLAAPQPGVKVDYASYLRAQPMERAWMHASGAIVTKLIPFVMLGAAFAMDAPAWTVGLLTALGVFQVLTDVLWSVKASDWKKFRRESAMRV
jgi:hypothetical protein